MDTAIVVFTRDLRLHDNPALHQASARARQVVPLVNPVSIVTGLESWIYRTNALEIGRFGPLYWSWVAFV